MILLLALLLAQLDGARVRICDKATSTNCATVGADGKVAVNASVNVAGAADVVSTAAPTTFSANAVCTGELLLAGEQGAGFQLNDGGTLVATLTPQYSTEASGSKWTTTQFIDQNGAKTPTLVTSNPTTLFQQGIVLVTGARRAQVCTTAYTSGSATGFAVAAYVQGGASAGASGLTDAQLRATPVPVSSTALPLPSNAAKETGGNLDSLVAKDFATQTTLALIKTDVDKIPGSPSTDRTTAAGPFSVRISDGAAFLDPRDISDRAARLVGIIYGSQSQQLKQTATNFNLASELFVGGTAIDPRSIRALTSADVVTANAGSGTFTVDVNDRAARLVGVLSTGSNIVGKVGIDQTTPGTTNLVDAGQNGIWTVQPGNTPNTTAWRVDASGTTVPISAVTLPLPVGASSDATVAETHAVTLGSIPTRQDMIAGSDYGYSCNSGACSQIPRVDANGNQYTAITGLVRVQVSQPMNSLLQRCNAVRRTNCQP